MILIYALPVPYLLLILCALNLVVESNASSVNLGGYSLFFNKKIANRIFKIISKEDKDFSTVVDSSKFTYVYEKNIGLILPFLGNIIDNNRRDDKETLPIQNLELSKILQNAIHRSLYVPDAIPSTDSYAFINSDGSIIVGLRQGIFGWNLFILRPIVIYNKLKNNKFQSIINLISMDKDDVNQLDKFLNLKFDLKVIYESRSIEGVKTTIPKKLDIQVASTSSGLTKSQVKQVVNCLSDILESKLETEIDIAFARIKYMKYNTHLNKQATKLKKLKNVDKILNPDKYKSHSPNVKRIGADSSVKGSGRYVPSAATQSRRVVKVKSR